MDTINKVKYLAVCWFLSVFIFGIAPRSQAVHLIDKEKEYLQSKEKIVFVSQTQYPPFEFMHENGQREGMMLDVVRWLAVEIGFRPVFVDMKFQEAQEAVLSEKVDVLTSLFYSEKRNERFAFTEVLYDVPASIFVKSERMDINRLTDLNKKVIAIQRGDYAKEFLESQSIGFQMLDTSDFADAIDSVIEGRADAIIGDEQVVIYHIYKNRLGDYIKRMSDPLYIGRNCMAANKDNALLVSILNKGIREAKESGVLKKISNKWLGTRYGRQESFLERHFLKSCIIAGGVLALSLWVWVWNLRLRTVVRKKTEAILGREEALLESREALSRSHEELQDTVQRLEQSGNMLQLIIESIPVRVFWKDGDLRYLGCNTLFARDAGLDKPEELLGLDDFAMTWHEQAEMYQSDDRQVMESGVVRKDILEPQRTPDGALIWLNTWKVPLRSPGGEVLGVLGVYEDITERRRTAEALSLRESYLTAIIENQPGLLWLKDAGGRFLSVNHAFARSCGRRRPEEVIGKTDLDIRPREMGRTISA